MSMIIPLPEDLDVALDKLAARRGVSKATLLIEGARMVVERAERDDQVGAALEAVIIENTGLLKRLKDA
ncbi:CopG family transcriptional regulator [Paeniglutamicibacter sp.]|uniref:ribbon-helix-helix domain-containing protein n=1 Tax=Paeniglutamicibacter sp. TaxID=1934391 RepID=UPI003989EFE6